MKANILKSAFAVAISVLALSSCVEEMLYITEQEEVKIQNNLVHSEGQIFTGEDAINLRIALAQDTILVEDFSELALTSDEFIFSDSQEASISTDVDGNYVVEEISFRDYEIEEYSINKRRVTVNFAVKYSHYGEKRDTILSPWYFQETPLKAIPQEPANVISYQPREQVTILEEGMVKVKFIINRLVDNVIDTTFSMSTYVSEVGPLYDMELHVLNNNYYREDSVVKEDAVERKVKDFILTSRTSWYKYETYFTTAAGGTVSPQSTIRMDMVEKVVFQNDEFSYTWTLKGTNRVKRAEIVQKGKSGKDIQGKYSPYIGTFQLLVESTLYSPQIEELSEEIVFFSQQAENDLYQRERVE
jgi:hypothetical protein